MILKNSSQTTVHRCRTKSSIVPVHDLGEPCRIILVALASALTYLICLSCQYWSKTVTMKLKVGILVIKRLIGWLVLNLHFTIPCRDNVLCAGPLCRADFGLGNARTAINVNYHGIVHHNREALPIICLDVVPCGIVRVSTFLASTMRSCCKVAAQSFSANVRNSKEKNLHNSENWWEFLSSAPIA